MFSEEEFVKLHRPRAEFLGNFIIFCFATIAIRLWYLQVYRGEFFYRYSLENRLRRETVFAERGIIFDRNGEILVSNHQRYNVIVIPQYLRDRDETLSKLAVILEMSKDDIEKILKRYSSQASYRPVVIKKDIPWDKVVQIEIGNLQLPGVRIDLTVSREYRDKEIGAHLLGYISGLSEDKAKTGQYHAGDYIGQGGIEEYFDDILRGENGHQFVQVDALGRIRSQGRGELSLENVTDVPAIAGHNIMLTIDRELQLIAYDLLKGQVGALVAMDVNTGEVLASISVPSFDSSQLSRGVTPEYWQEITQNPYNPMIDRTIQEHYSPGSVFKVVTLMAALEEGLIDETSELSCEGSVVLGRKRYHCWKYHGHGDIGPVAALAESCDVFFYKLGMQLDIDILANYARMFEFGKTSKIDLPREISGLIPTKDWKLKRYGEPWQRGENLSCAIGQSYILTTIMQLARTYSAIANGGKFYKPYVVGEIFASNGNVIRRNSPTISSELMASKKSLDVIREGLFNVVNNKQGTAYASRGNGIEMSGKTGTSQVASFSAEKIYSKCTELDYKLRHHAVFAGYAPASDPKIAVAVIVEHGCSGSAVAAPIVKTFIEKYMQKYHPDLYLKLLKNS